MGAVGDERGGRGESGPSINSLFLKIMCYGPSYFLKKKINNNKKKIQSPSLGTTVSESVSQHHFGITLPEAGLKFSKWREKAFFIFRLLTPLKGT